MPALTSVNFPAPACCLSNRHVGLSVLGGRGNELEKTQDFSQNSYLRADTRDDPQYVFSGTM